MMLSYLKKTAPLIACVTATLVILAFMVAVANMVSLQDAFNDYTASDFSHAYISHTPFDTPTGHVIPGKTYFMNVDVVRHGDCFVDIDWRFVRLDDTGNVVFWGYPGGRLFAKDGSRRFADAFLAPASLTPGRYVIQRLAHFQCSANDAPADIVTEVPFRVEAE